MNLDWDELSPEERDARITSLLLGELAPSEAKQLRDTISADPELARACERRERTIGLLREAAHRQHPAGEVPASPAVASRLSDDRRQKLLESFKSTAPSHHARIRSRIPSWFVPMSAAAVLIGLLVLAAGVTGGLSRAKARAQRTRLPAYGASQVDVTGEENRIALYSKQAALGKRVESSGQLQQGPREPNLGEFREARYKVEAARKSTGTSAAAQPQTASAAQIPTIPGSEYFALTEARDVAAPASPIVNEVMLRTAPILGDATLSATDKERDVSKLTGAGNTGNSRTKDHNDSIAATITLQNEGQLANYSVAPARDFFSVKPLGSLPATAPVPAPVSSTPDPNGSIYSVNDVGYVNTAITNGYNLIQNPVAQSEQQSTAGGGGASYDQPNRAGTFGRSGSVPARPIRPEEGMAVNFANTDSPLLRSEMESLPDVALRVSAGDNVQSRGRRDSAPALAGSQWFDQSQPQSAVPPLPSIGARLSEVAQAGGRTSDFDWSGKNDGLASANTWRSVSGATDLNRNAAVSLSDKDGDGMERRSQSLATPRGFFDDNVSFSQLPANADGKKSLNDTYGLNELADTDAFTRIELLKERKTDPMSELKSVTADSLLPLVEAEKLPPLTDPSGHGTRVVTDLDVDAAGLPITSEDESGRQRRAGVLLGPATVTRPNMSQPRTPKIPKESAKAEPRALDVSPTKPGTPAPVPQPDVLTRDNAFSTFSLNVSDVSFKLAAASLEKGAMPDVVNIRSEEFINAFDYRDAQPAPSAPIAFAWERARYPFAHNRDVVRFSVKTAAQGREAGKPLNIVLLLDNSGSMERADRVRIIQESLRTLAAQLKPQDKLSVVTFSRTASLRVDGASGTNAAEVAKQIGALTPEGGTNLEDALDLAYKTALRHYAATAVNRVVLLTDGAANLGNVEPKELKAKVEGFRKQGIALDCFGIGWEGFNDDLLEQLSRNGDGRYGFVNSPEEAASEFVGQLAGALRVAASDVKMQVEFNPKRVTTWRQIGYAKHQLTKQQFRDNTVDAAEIGAAESGNALYVIETNPNGEGPIATVRARFRVPQRSDFREHEWVVPFGSAVELEQSSLSLRLAASASAFSEWLAGSPFAGEVTTDRLLGILSGVPEVYGADPRPKKLEWMIRQAKSISGK